MAVFVHSWGDYDQQNVDEFPDIKAAEDYIAKLGEGWEFEAFQGERLKVKVVEIVKRVRLER